MLSCDVFVVCMIFAYKNALLFIPGSPGRHAGSERGADPRGGIRSGEDQRRDTGTHRAR